MSDRTPVILYGTGAVASVVRFLLEHDSDYQVAALTADGEYEAAANAMGLPFVPFDEVAEQLPPADYPMFVAMGFSRMNTVRAAKCHEARSMGYELIRPVSSRASVWPDLTTGPNTIIMERAVIGPDVVIGDDCIIWPGAYIGHGARIGDHCYIAANASISGLSVVGSRCVIGTAAVVRDGTTVGDACVVGVGAVLTSDLAANTIIAAPRPRTLPGSSHRLPNL